MDSLTKALLDAADAVDNSQHWMSEEVEELVRAARELAAVLNLLKKGVTIIDV